MLDFLHKTLAIVNRAATNPSFIDLNHGDERIFQTVPEAALLKVKDAVQGGGANNSELKEAVRAAKELTIEALHRAPDQTIAKETLGRVYTNFFNHLEQLISMNPESIDQVPDEFVLNSVLNGNDLQHPHAYFADQAEVKEMISQINKINPHDTNVHPELISSLLLSESTITNTRQVAI